MKDRLFKTPLSRLRTIAVSEGVSFLLLLGIAMPMKYFLDMPQAVKVFGWAHGLFFILYMAALLDVTVHHRWSLRKVMLAVLASVTPFGPFILEARLLKQERNTPLDPKS